MLDISLHLLDLLQNSAHAGASEVEVAIREDLAEDILEVIVEDNGSGMDGGSKEKVLDPFYTTSQKKVGLGLPLVAQAAAMAGGSIRVDSEPGKGTKVTAAFRLSHVDRQPLGDIAATAVSFVAGNPDIDLTLRYRSRDGRGFAFSTAKEFPRKVRQSLGQVGFLGSLEDKLRDGLAKAGFSPDGGGVGVEVD